VTYASGNQLVADDGSLIADFPSHWAACAAMIQISNPSFRSLGRPTPFELGWAAGLTGTDPRLCPFDKLTSEWSEWQSFHGKAAQYMTASTVTSNTNPVVEESGTAAADTSVRAGAGFATSTLSPQDGGAP
jgi:hypothetical protein